MFAVVVVLGAYLKASTNAWYEHNDFHCFWSAGRLVAEGADPYDPQLYQTMVAGGGPITERTIIECGTRFPFPPWTVLLLAPFGAMPLPLAATLWTALFLGATGLGLAWSWSLAGGGRPRLLIFLVLVLSSEPFLLALQNAQFGPLSLVLFSGGLILMRQGRDLGAGAALAALAIKPQIVLISLPAVLVRAGLGRRGGVIAGAVAAAAVGSIVSILLLPSSIAVLAGYASRSVGVTVPLASLWDLGASLDAPLLAPIAIVLLGLLLFALVRGRAVDDATLAGIAVAFSLAVTPYAWSYDYVLLALPWALTLGRVRAIAGSRGTLVFLLQVLVASPLAWGLYLLAFSRGGETLSPIVPAASAVLLALAVRWDTSSSPREARRE
jgi:Glycosyltransferase family 87